MSAQAVEHINLAIFAVLAVVLLVHYQRQDEAGRRRAVSPLIDNFRRKPATSIALSGFLTLTVLSWLLDGRTRAITSGVSAIFSTAYVAMTLGTFVAWFLRPRKGQLANGVPHSRVILASAARSYRRRADDARTV